MKHYKLYILSGLLLIAFFTAPYFYPNVPVIVTQASLKDVTRITDPEHAQAYYGSLQDFPHTFEIRTHEPRTFSVNLYIPDTDDAKNNISAIIIKIPETKSRVEEITRLRAKDVPWDSKFSFIDGNTYRIGPSFEQTLDPGTYRIQVHTPDNREKYVLILGKEKEMTLGYFELMGRIVEIKEFFGKSKLRSIESPLIYIPLILFSLLMYALWRLYRESEIISESEKVQ